MEAIVLAIIVHALKKRGFIWGVEGELDKLLRKVLKIILGLSLNLPHISLIRGGL